MQEAEGYRSRVVEQAQGDAARFRQIVAEYSKAPQVTRDRLYLDAMQQIMTSTTKVLIDQKGGGNLLYLPLDKLMQMTAAGVASGAAPEVPASAKLNEPAAPAADSAARGREAFRSREREARQ